MSMFGYKRGVLGICRDFFCIPIAACAAPIHSQSSPAPGDMSSALECQPLRHYSDFETASESGVSDLSYVQPYTPKKYEKQGKFATPTSTEKAIKRGARAMRRYENDAYLNNLSVIAEMDAEEVASMVWPDSITQCSAFKRLFENQSLRAVWDKFITLSETEQAKLLSSLRHRNEDESDDEELVEVSLDEYASESEERPYSRRTGNARSRPHRSKRGHRKPKVRSSSTSCLTALGDESAGDINLVEQRIQGDSVPDSQGEIIQPELRGSLPVRFRMLLLKSQNSSHGRGRKRRGKHIDRFVTTLDLCLIDRTERELRRWFGERASNAQTQSSGSRLAFSRWTPTTSLLCEDEESSPPEPLRLDAFERLLVHSVAGYLGLSSYSAWSEPLGGRQLWAESIIGQPFAPPQQTFVSLIEAHLTES
ncbi:unnamed protein product [Calicophoron daubneyi]|uniref:R3H-associated N-terminal domain-containing protein n=1 Tax=Calicophoron daubneyi TaxID=300641 RepID=A0AAV2T753_CALDB